MAGEAGVNRCGRRAGSESATGEAGKVAWGRQVCTGEAGKQLSIGESRDTGVCR